MFRRESTSTLPLVSKIKVHRVLKPTEMGSQKGSDAKHLGNAMQKKALSDS